MKMRPDCTPQHRHVRTRPQGGASEGSKLAPLLVLARNRTPKNIQRPKKKKQKQQRHRVTPLLAQRITLPGNSYFWRTGGGSRWNRREPGLEPQPTPIQTNGV